MDNDTITAEEHLNNFIGSIVDAIPKLLGALVILVIGYFVAKGLASIVRKLLARAQLDSRLHSGKGGNVLQRAVPSPTLLASQVTFWIIYLFTISIAVSVLGIPILVEMVRSVYAYVPNIIASIIIFLIASALSAGVATFITNVMGDTPTGKILATSGPVIIMGLAVFMILNQLKIAPEIVTITYAALVGSASLGTALAFGLGGRDVAGRLLENMYDASQRHKQRIVDDVKKGAENTRQAASQKTSHL